MIHEYRLLTIDWCVRGRGRGELYSKPGGGGELHIAHPWTDHRSKKQYVYIFGAVEVISSVASNTVVLTRIFVIDVVIFKVWSQDDVSS